MSKPLKIFTDFDGTISLIDTGDLIVDHCIGPQARRAIDDRIVAGELSFKDGYQTQYAGVNLTWAEARRRLRLDTGLDPTFAPFVRWVEAKGIPLVVLSSGFEEFIRQYFKPAGLDYLDVKANRISVKGRQWRIHFRDDTPFGHDKAAALRQAQAEGYHTIFIGDGISDIPAAAMADLLFAKTGERLAEYCRQQGLQYHPFVDFNDIVAHLSRTQ